MANEIQFQGSLMASKNGTSINKNANANLSMAGSQMTQQTMNVPTAWTLLVFGNLAGVPAKLMIKNLDPTNYVQLAGDNAGAQLQDKIQPGGDFVLRSPVGVIYAKANAAACLIEYAAMDQ
ncbi:MAG: hypothetical protein KGL39_57795 [Patescibacteria group bacterium]|nr:hypothetical protein [Patescibacteria group bacterium]